jgi:hypothetical protein
VEALAIAALLAAKFLVYSLYLGSLARRWNLSAPGWKWALVRIGLGLAAGGILWLIARGPGTGGGPGIDVYVVGLGMGRIVAWTLTLVLAFGERVRAPSLLLAMCVGVALSYVLDIPMFLGFLEITGGIC